MKILFVTHDASRSGAPLVLLYLMRWITQHKKDVQLDILYVNGGALESDFNNLCINTFSYPNYLKRMRANKYLRVFKRVLNKLTISSKSEDSSFFKSIAKNNYDIIYANSVVSLPFAHQIKLISPSTKLLIHVHELQTIILTLLPDFKKYIPNVDKFITVSEQVKQNLITNWKISTSLIDVVYECAIVNLRSLKKTNSDFIIGASGLSYWRKGNDVFLQVARYVTKHHPELNIKFNWVGNEYLDKPIIDADIKKLSLSNRVEFIGETDQPEKAYNEFDVFLMTSREDPFPLVCIEVAKLSKPIICFENASGSAEVIKKGGGFVVPYLDIEAMGNKIIHYYHNQDQMIKDGEKAKELFEDFTPEKICPQLYLAIENLIQ